MQAKRIEAMTLKELKKLQGKVEKRIDLLTPRETKTMGDPIAKVAW